MSSIVTALSSIAQESRLKVYRLLVQTGTDCLHLIQFEKNESSGVQATKA